MRRVRAAIEQLPPGQREVLTMHKLQGMTMAQVAEALQIREGAVRVRAHRGYKNLAKLLGASTLLLLDLGHLVHQVHSSGVEGRLG